MALRFLHFVEPDVVHAEFLDGLDQTEVGLRPAHRAAEGLGPLIDIVQPCELQPGIAAADIAAEPHLSIGLGECAEGEGTIGPRSNHGARLEPANDQWRFNFLPAVLATFSAKGRVSQGRIQLSESLTQRVSNGWETASG